jgi:hypothetical protein
MYVIIKVYEQTNKTISKVAYSILEKSKKRFPIKGVKNYVKPKTNTYTNSMNELMKYKDESKILRSSFIL